MSLERDNEHGYMPEDMDMIDNVDDRNEHYSESGTETEGDEHNMVCVCFSCYFLFCCYLFALECNINMTAGCLSSLLR